MNPIEKARGQLHELQRLPENRTCMDCGARDPRWASMNLGIFICIKCAGAHRSLGTHISLVKSLDQDNWTLDQVEFMRKKGNANAKKYFEATLKPSDTWENSAKKVVSETIALEAFVRRKYEYLEFTPKKETGLSNSGNTKPRSSTTSAPTTGPAFVLPSYESTRKSKDDFSMGFDARPADYLTTDFKAHDGVTKSDIMQLYDTPKLQPTQTPAAKPKQVAPPTPNYPAPNYNVNVHAPAYPPNYGYNPTYGHNPTPQGYNFGNPIAPQSPYGNPHLPSYANTVPPPPYGTPYAPPSSGYVAQPPKPSPDMTPPLPPKTNPFTSLPALGGSYGAPPLNNSYGAPPLNNSYGAPPLNNSYGAPPLSASYGAPPLNTSLGTPYGNYGVPPPRPTYSAPAMPQYGQPTNPYGNPNDPNFIASQFNLR